MFKVEGDRADAFVRPGKNKSGKGGSTPGQVSKKEGNESVGVGKRFRMKGRSIPGLVRPAQTTSTGLILPNTCGRNGMFPPFACEFPRY